MRIDTKLQVNIFLPIAITLLILLILASAMAGRAEADRNNAAALSLLSEMTQLNQRTYYYLLYHEERARREWFSIYDALAALAGRLDLSDPEQAAVVERIRRNLGEMRSIFAERIVGEGQAGRGSGQLLKERQDRLSSQLLIRARSVTGDAYHLYELSASKLRRADAKANTLILLLLLASVLVTLSTLFPMNRKLSSSISRLAAGASLIGKGNLDHRIGISTDDEIGELSAAFDRMTASLKATTVSRDELAAEVTRRKRVEEALRSSEAILKQAGQMARLGAWHIEFVNELDPDRNPLHWSDEVYRIFGYEPGGVTVTNALFFGHVHPDERALVRSAVAEAIAKRVPYSVEHRIVRTDGSERFVLEHAEIFFGPEGRPARMIGAVQDITERKRAEQAVRISEESYRAVFNSSNDAIFIHDIETGRILDVNDTTLRLYGYTRDEIRSVNVERLSEPVSGFTQQAALEALRKAAAGEPQIFEWLARNKAGRTFWVEVSLKRATLGGNDRLLAVVHDIDERKRNDEAFRRVSQQNELILEHAGEGIFGLDLKGMVTFVNARAAHLLGYHRGELMGTHSHTTWHYRHADGSAYPPADCPIYAAYKEGAVRSGEEIFWRKDGTSFPVDFTSRPLYVSGRITGAVVIYRDITERKRAETELRESEERFRVMYEQAAIGIEMLDLGGRYLSGNGALGALLGYSEEELQQLTFASVTDPDDLARELPLIRELLEGRLPSYSIEKRYRTRTGAAVWVRVTSSLARTSRPYRISIIEDITERKRGEQELTRLVGELERSNKELEQFAYVASHDLQEPLRMVASYVQLFERKYKGSLDDKADKYIFFAVDGVKRMQKLIDGLLAYSRVSRGASFGPVDMNRAFGQALANLMIAVREAGAVVTRDELPRVTGDETQLAQVFQNLIGNAVKFRKRGETPRVHVSARRADGGWLFSVADNGIGIDPQYAQRIFQIFQRLHSREEYPGTGIGLSLCKRIVERHGGDIWVESEPGRGATFTFSIPERMP